MDLNHYIKNYFNDEEKIHKFNEPIQRSWWLNDKSLNLDPEDIIIDIDVDEIIYGRTFDNLINEIEESTKPLSIKLNLFFYKEISELIKNFLHQQSINIKWLMNILKISK